MCNTILYILTSSLLGNSFDVGVNNCELVIHWLYFAGRFYINVFIDQVLQTHRMVHIIAGYIDCTCTVSVNTSYLRIEVFWYLTVHYSGVTKTWLLSGGFEIQLLSCHVH